jgi:hypothetical protein
VQTIIDFLKFGIIFGVLATAPIVAWIAIAWLVTDRRRTSSAPDERCPSCGFRRTAPAG